MINDKIKSKVIGINVDTTTTTIAVVDLRGNIVAQDSIPTQNFPNVNNFVEALSERVGWLREYTFGRYVRTKFQLPDGLYRECTEYAVERYHSHCRHAERQYRTGCGAGQRRPCDSSWRAMVWLTAWITSSW